MKTLDFNTIVRSLKPRDLAVIRALREGREIVLTRSRRFRGETLTGGEDVPLEKEAINFLQGAGFISFRHGYTTGRTKSKPFSFLPKTATGLQPCADTRRNRNAKNRL